MIEEINKAIWFPPPLKDKMSSKQGMKVQFHSPCCKLVMFEHEKTCPGCGAAIKRKPAKKAKAKKK